MRWSSAEPCPHHETSIWSMPADRISSIWAEMTSAFDEE
jgi:hypothetical protein